MLDKLTWYDPDGLGGDIASKDLPTIGLWDGRSMLVTPLYDADVGSVRFRARWHLSDGTPLSGEANPIDSLPYVPVRSQDGRVFRMGLERSKYLREDKL